MSRSMLCRMIASPCVHATQAARLKAHTSILHSPLASNVEGTFFWPIVEGLKTLLPPALPVVVKVGRAGSRCHGFCEGRRSSFLIMVSDDLVPAHAIDVLQHEWAHALAWNLLDDRLSRKKRLPSIEFERLSHGSEWGVAFSKVYVSVGTEICPALAKGMTFVPRKPRRRK